MLTNGWNAEACGGIGAFTTAYDGPTWTPRRCTSACPACWTRRTSGSRPRSRRSRRNCGPARTVYRYHRDDGLPGAEGGFHLCAAWMIEAYLLTGRRTEAEELFDQLVDAAGPTGLLPEEYDPIAERSLGNHPQAYSHLGLIRCAQLLERE